MGIERTYLNLIKFTFDNPTFNITLNIEKLKAFPLTSGMRQRYPLSPLLFSTVLEVPVVTITQEKESKCAQNQKKELNPFLFTDDLVLYIENPKEYTHTHTYTQTKNY